MKNVFCTLKKLSIALITISLFSLTYVFGQQQKQYKMEENTFYNGEEALYRIEKMSNNDVILKSLSGKRLILFQPKVTADKSKYYEVHFLTNNTKAEIKNIEPLQLGAFVAEAKLIVKGELNPEAAKKFVTENKEPYSKPSTAK